MTIITVKETKNQWQDSYFTLFIDDKQSEFTHYGSRKLTDTCNEDGDGIFNREVSLVKFKRKDTWVTVDFGEDEDGNSGFRIVNFSYHDDTSFISFSDVPQEAYFLNLTRID